MPEVSQDLAGEFVLGVLDADERLAVQRRMREEPEYRSAVDSWLRRLMPLTEPVSPAQPPASAWAAIQPRLGSIAPSPARRGFEGVWLAVGPGATMKMLHVDLTTGERTALMRMEPGSSCPAHDHEQTEECFVFEVGFHIDGQDYTSGDCIIARAGSRHGVVPGGLLLHWIALATQGAAGSA